MGELSCCRKLKSGPGVIPGPLFYALRTKLCDGSFFAFLAHEHRFQHGIGAEQEGAVKYVAHDGVEEEAAEEVLFVERNGRPVAGEQPGESMRVQITEKESTKVGHQEEDQAGCHRAEEYTAGSYFTDAGTDEGYQHEACIYEQHFAAIDTLDVGKEMKEKIAQEERNQGYCVGVLFVFQHHTSEQRTSAESGKVIDLKIIRHQPSQYADEDQHGYEDNVG